jgi:hypothetical protein
LITVKKIGTKRHSIAILTKQYDPVSQRSRFVRYETAFLV